MGPPAICLFLLAVPATLSFTGSALSSHQTTVDLGAAESFGALSATAMTNAGAPTVVNGDVGSSTSIDAGVTHPGYGAYGAGTPELAGAQAALLTAYGFAEAQAPTQPSITGSNLGGDTLLPGVYNSTGGILIDDLIPLTLDGNGDPTAVFIFQAASSGVDVLDRVHERRSAVQRLLEGQLAIPEGHELHVHRDDPRPDPDHAHREHHRRGPRLGPKR